VSHKKAQKAQKAQKIFSVLCVLIVGWGQIAAQSSLRASITIDVSKVENRISPLLYGQFLEFMFEGIKGGLHAELIRNRSFEEPANVIGLSRNWDRYPDDRNDDYALSFHRDDQFSYPLARKEHSLRVHASEGVIQRHGVYQSRIPVRAGVEYRGYLWVKTDDYDGRITVALESDLDQSLVNATADVTINKGNWRKYEFLLKATRTDPLARFAILFHGKGKLWIDQVSLIPGDAASGGVRSDVFEKIKQLKPAFIRWPGGNVAQDYRWMLGVGPRDERATWTNLSWKNEPESNDFGADEFVAFARAAGAEPSITINVEGAGATVEEAAAWVEYCNGPASSKYGAMRAANGHAAPFNVKLWEVGNEIWGDWVRGHSDAETYARNYNRYAKAMRAVDPSIKLIAAGDNDMKWNRTVLSAAGANIDYLAIHHYYGRRELHGDASNLMARPLHLERFYREVEQMLRELGLEGRVKLAINEWGLDLPTERQYSMESALYGARLMNVFERAGRLVEMSAVSDLVNGWPGGIIQAGRQSVFVSPIFLVNQLYNEHRGDVRLSTTVNSPTFNTSREGSNIPYLDVVVTRTTDGKKIFIKAVNTNPTSSFVTTINLQGTAEIQTITAPSLNAFNDFSHPNSISISTQAIKSARQLSVTLPKHSVSVITLAP
jgi:alpha-N-arabinofuranosidase